jgi:exopolyphosphatase / guanosine-5'-triphosphate,3'-diphosphate pyrophosphatase
VTRVAAIDLGTNSTRLLVAEVEDGRVTEIERRLEITRLGEAVDRRRRLLPTAIARVRGCLTGYRRALESHGVERVLAIGTSAVRDAENGEAFLGELEWSYGFETRLLTGEEEAMLTFRGVAAGRLLAPETLIVDVGGGSTELVVGGPEGLSFRASLDFGCVRLTERFLASDPPAAEELHACAAAVRGALPELRPKAAIGVAGTVTSLAALDLGLVEYDPDRVHRHVLSSDAVRHQLERLAGLPVAERRRVPGLEPERAPVIVAGAVIVLELLSAFGLDALEASERDILDGVALAAAELPLREEGAASTPAADLSGQTPFR